MRKMTKGEKEIAKGLDKYFMDNMTRGDIYRHREDGDLILVGDVNELGGTCDHCHKDMNRYELVGNIIDTMKELEPDALASALGKHADLIEEL